MFKLCLFIPDFYIVGELPTKPQKAGAVGDTTDIIKAFTTIGFVSNDNYK